MPIVGVLTLCCVTTLYYAALMVSTLKLRKREHPDRTQGKRPSLLGLAQVVQESGSNKHPIAIA